MLFQYFLQLLISWLRAIEIYVLYGLVESDSVKAKSRRERRQWWGVLGRRGSARGSSDVCIVLPFLSLCHKIQLLFKHALLVQP